MRGDRSRLRRECLVNDPLGHVEITTNGSHKVSDHEAPEPSHEGPPPLSAQSVDERLEALMETIRTWDWRAAAVEAGPRPADEAVSTVSGAATTAIAEVREDLEPFAYRSSPVQSAADTQTVVPEAPPRPVTDPPVAAYPTAEHQTVVAEPPPRPVTFDPPVAAYPTADTQTVVPEAPPRPVTFDPVVPLQPEHGSSDTSSASHPSQGPGQRPGAGLLVACGLTTGSEWRCCAWPPP